MIEYSFPIMSMHLGIDGRFYPQRLGRELHDQAMERLVDRLTEDCDEHDRHAIAAQLWFGWRGPWLPRQIYARHELVTHRDLVWLALEQTVDEPGETRAWSLAAERLRFVPCA